MEELTSVMKEILEAMQAMNSNLGRIESHLENMRSTHVSMNGNLEDIASRIVEMGNDLCTHLKDCERSIDSITEYID